MADDDNAANRRVAHNLRRGRELRNLTQEQAAERISLYTSKPWTRQSVWRAEKSLTAETRRVRKFDADELVAFTRAFRLPLAFFFLPVAGDENAAEALLPLFTTNHKNYWRPFMQRIDLLLTERPELWRELLRLERERYRPSPKTEKLTAVFHMWNPDEEEMRNHE
jgi:transcriptional regulator with XRE-family HTH domain